MLFRGKLSRNKHHTLPFRKAYHHLRVKLLWNNVCGARGRMYRVHAAETYARTFQFSLSVPLLLRLEPFRV